MDSPIILVTSNQILSHPIPFSGGLRNQSRLGFRSGYD